MAAAVGAEAGAAEERGPEAPRLSRRAAILLSLVSAAVAWAGLYIAGAVLFAVLAGLVAGSAP